MDSRQFDALTRALGTSGTRRALSAQLGSAVGWLTISPDVPGVAVARKNKKQNKNKKRRQKGKVRVEGPCGNGSGKANRCKRNSQCCTNHCDKKKGRCRCLKAGQACDSDRLCCPGRTGRSCQGGTCQPALPCDGDVCASGCPESSLQAAIDAANDGATIRLCAETYQETIVIAKDITLIGAGDGADPASNTILDAANSGRVVTIGSGHTVVFEGLRITGGSTSSVVGGGVLNGVDSSLTMTGCTVTGNTATGHGGGIDNNGGTVTLNGCSIDQNIASVVDARGGGIHSHNGGALTLNGSSVTGNTASQGGGIYVASGTATLDGSSVTGNTAADGGGGIYNEGSSGATIALQNGTVVEDNEPDNCAGPGAINGPGCAP